LESSEAEFPLPDLALLFELEPRLCLERVHARGGTPEPAFERLDQLERVAAVFHSLDRRYLVRVDARGAVDEVGARVDTLLADRLGLA
jgi:dTMP kinase